MNEELTSKALEYLETAVKLASNELPKFTNELLNYFIFSTTLNILQNFIWMILVVLIVRTLNVHIDFLKLQSKDKLSNEILTWSLIRNLISVVVPIVLIIVSMPQLKVVGKLVIAPKVFLVEEGSKLVEKYRK